MRKSFPVIASLIVLLSTAVISACGGGNNSKAVSLQIVDAGGYVSQFGQSMMDAFRQAHPDEVSSITYVPRIQAPTLPGRLQAEEGAGQVQDSLIISGYDGVASAVKAGLVDQLTPAHSDKFPNLDSNYQTPAKQYNDLAQGYALVFTYTPSGPLFGYNPAAIANPPQTIAQLKQWIIAHPKKFLYARPANSGPGRTLLMGLPYLLGDSNPQDPTNGWAKTWQFLKDIKPYTLTYPTKTSETIKDVADGTVDMIASTFGWDINQRALSQMPANYKTFELQGTHFVADAGFMMMPKGLDAAHQKVVLDLMAFMLSPQAQALTYDSGYFYPGPAIQNVPLTMAPQSSQDTINKYLYPEYATEIQNTKVEMPLGADNLVAAFNMWDSQIGGINS
jgi:putative spermidine/putrescine transport system substrate-binding protein